MNVTRVGEFFRYCIHKEAFSQVSLLVFFLTLCSHDFFENVLKALLLSPTEDGKAFLSYQKELKTSTQKNRKNLNLIGFQNVCQGSERVILRNAWRQGQFVLEKGLFGSQLKDLKCKKFKVLILQAPCSRGHCSHFFNFRPLHFIIPLAQL